MSTGVKEIEVGEERKVLVVDDDADMVLLCRMQLTGRGFDVVSAVTGTEALSAVQASRPDVVVLDYSLPDLDGPEVVGRMRDVLGVDTPVVMVTARTGIDDQETAWHAGVSDYVIKPFDEARLVQAVEAALSPDDDARQRADAALERLRSNEVAVWRQMAAVIEHSDDAIITKTLDGTITSWNPAAERLYGYSAAEAIGRNITLIATPESAHESPDILERIARGEKVSHYETVRQRRDGEAVHVSLSVSPVIGADGSVAGAAVIGRDVGERRRLDQRFRALVEAAPDAMVIVDEAGLIELVNAQTENLFGYPRAELIGRPVEMLVPHRFRDGHPAHRAEYAKNPRVRPMGEGIELTGLRRDGSEFPIEISLSPIETDNGPSVAAAIRDVTERKQAETMFRGLLEAAPDAIVGVDADGRIRLVNAQAEALFGYTRDELVGQLVEILIPVAHHGAHAEHRDRYFSDPVTRPMGADLDLVARRKDGSEVPVEISLSSIETADGRLVSAAIRDVTDRTEAEALFRGLVDSAPTAMVIVDIDGKIQLVNAQTERLFGYDRDELIGEPVEILVPHRFHGRHPGHRFDYARAPKVRPMGVGLELLGRRKDGSEFPVEISLSPLQTRTGTIVSASIHDVTERAQAEAARATALEREKEVSQRLREVDRLRTDFLSTVSHELRTPLTAIKGFAEILGDRSHILEAQDRNHLIERISASADRLDDLINDLLDFSRLERGLLRVTPEVCDARSIVARAIERSQLAVGDHRVVNAVPEGIEVFVDPTAIARVLENLLSNAAKFSEPASTITVAATVTDQRVDLSVHDEGEGIDASELDRIFDRFYRAGGAENRKPGTGVGLAIVKELTEAQGGTVSVESRPGTGTGFTVSLRPGATHGS